MAHGNYSRRRCNICLLQQGRMSNNEFNEHVVACNAIPRGARGARRRQQRVDQHVAGLIGRMMLHPRIERDLLGQYPGGYPIYGPPRARTGGVADVRGEQVDHNGEGEGVVGERTLRRPQDAADQPRDAVTCEADSDADADEADDTVTDDGGQRRLLTADAVTCEAEDTGEDDDAGEADYTGEADDTVIDDGGQRRVSTSGDGNL
ncbi:uncharacterized protein A4U43_C05F30860 [Asparagus officinalis]|uniref:Uncharacterized protein n=1 Tax=Asparagus officinalis TaxID=4686 RepID=A0A5P1EY86_ASPOF|nr:uncharacterized protein LOC109840260 [Asparagus officinalis]ONK70157.1 uncharacterized protein A4U43_C05F30860 [Asparagus officinalis]